MVFIYKWRSRTGDGVDRGVVRVRDDERELGAGVPFLRALGVAVVEVDRHCIVWRGVGVAEGE